MLEEPFFARLRSFEDSVGGAAPQEGRPAVWF